MNDRTITERFVIAVISIITGIWIIVAILAIALAVKWLF